MKNYLKRIWDKICCYSRKFINYFWILMSKIPFGSKHKPRAVAIVEYDTETKQPIGEPFFIIRNSNGEYMNAPGFSTLKEAEAWIENYLLEEEQKLKPN